ncbi:cupin domain-containing protein [Microbacterium sp. H1-D42]|uniref:cupin domain-containing protein n=1 Tax=Microbacterium sp. H1-D42 TaxID=2925844 RepID=UPI001F531399|nr:cupin domain-containing protein [Microbacterium sp. H1-D42]UNK70429.1 cupin domain-containing protein [Microbacterium sp. H1-D42]
MTNVTQIGALDAWGGDKGKHFIEKEIGAQFAGISVNTTEPGGESPYWHSHARLEEIYIVIDGRGEIVLDDEVVPLEAGTVVRAAPGVMHALRCLPDSPTALRWLCVRSAGMALADVGRDAELDKDRPYPWNA